MYDELGPDGRRKHTVQQMADEFGVTRPTIYRHLQRPLAEHHSRSMSALLQIAIVAAALWSDPG